MVAFSFHFHLFESVHNCHLSTVANESEGGIFSPFSPVWVCPQLPVNLKVAFSFHFAGSNLVHWTSKSHLFENLFRTFINVFVVVSLQILVANSNLMHLIARPHRFENLFKLVNKDGAGTFLYYFWHLFSSITLLMLFADKHDGAGICFCSLSKSLQTLFADPNPVLIYLKVSPVWESVQSCWWTRWWRFSSGGPECCRCQRCPHRTGSGRRCWHPRLTDPAACSRKWGQSTREGEHWRSHSPEPATAMMHGHRNGTLAHALTRSGTFWRLFYSSAPSSANSRMQQWPHGAMQQQQLWGNMEDLVKTTTCIQTTRLCEAKLCSNTEEEDMVHT